MFCSTLVPLQLLVVVLFGITACEDKNAFIKKRTKALQTEKLMKLGGFLHLDVGEKRVNETLMKMKFQEIYKARQANDSIPPAQHFFTAKAAIDRSSVFRFIRKMPKGESKLCDDAKQLFCACFFVTGHKTDSFAGT